MDVFSTSKIWVILVWCHITAFEGMSDERVKVFSMQKGVWTVPTNKVYLRYVFPQTQEPLHQLTLCYRIRYESLVYSTMHFSYATSDKISNALTIFNRKNRLRSIFQNDGQLGVQKKEWPGYPDMWQHLCHVYKDGSYAVYLQGEEFFKGPLLGELPLAMNGTVILGQDQDSLGGGFAAQDVLRGDITQVDIWDRPVRASEIFQIAMCKKSSTGNVMSSAVTNFEVFGDVKETTVLLTDLCRYHPRYAILTEERSFAASTALCHLFNSSQAVPTSAFENDLLHKQLIPFFDACQPDIRWKLWIGLTDLEEEDVYKNDCSKEVASYLNFSSLYPTSSAYLNCMEMLDDGQWVLDTCEPHAKRCTACYFEKSDFLYLRGLCFDNNHQNRFHIYGYANGRLLIKGYYKYVIMWENDDHKWLLREPDKNITIAYVQLTDFEGYPLGVHKWQLEKPICGNPPNTALTLSISSCSSSHFMCNSGECIPIEKRCNLRYDCTDGSDEDACNMVVLSGSYRNYLAPTGENNTMLKVLPVVIINRVASVDELNQVITLEFEINLSWKDNRLKFKYLEVSKKGASLSQDDIEKVWYPKYRITNLEGGQVKELQKSIIVRDSYNATLPPFNSVDMDLTYPGSENAMTISQRYTAKFTCSFELYTYPFDVQVCSIDFLLPTNYDGYVEFDNEKGYAKYTGKERLSLFSIRNAKLITFIIGNKLSATFELHRQQGVIMMSTFLPSVLLLWVSWATLFVKIQSLNVRAVMSLTTLLVLYTLFAQLSSSLPRTAAIKLIDIWFFFIIFLLFSNIMAHIFCEVVGRTETQVKLNTMDSGGRLKAWSARVKWPTPEDILSMHRWIIVPTAFIIFNMIFWWQVFDN